ncbi:HlyD family efflux transporter periplasmic adaptor subunit [Sphingobium sp. Sx8-8]|uniref:HlyD family efflux transporter periplasmic adaptor subunit n=1 Tax=Sphingobium sp. Sx8-8 TaxID=2933617 RepID=UPI001F5A2594|nr:HlyD family efflux transporter periplasmic adaptor subunit [Sphingobium sp. Sx8-8]
MSDRSFFRQEALEQRSERLPGQIHITIPLSWQAFGLFLLAMLIAATAWLFTASYSQTVQVSGVITPSSGLIHIRSTRGGRIVSLLVSEGQFVRKGQALAQVDVQERNESGLSAQMTIISSLRRQEIALEAQGKSVKSASKSNRDALHAQITGLSEEIEMLKLQVKSQERLVTMAQDQVELTKNVASKGFVSKRYLSGIEEDLLLKQQQLYSLRQSFSSKSSQLNQALHAAEEEKDRSLSESSGLEAARQAVERDAAAVQGDREYWLYSPIDGQISSQGVKHNDLVSAQEDMMLITPSESKLNAQLRVPATAIGFMRPGQKIQIALDSYPYERFGTIVGRVQALASAPTLRSVESETSGPSYSAIAQIDQSWIGAYGQKQNLLPGMTFKARVIIGRRSLIEWLFDPLFAVAQP